MNGNKPENDKKDKDLWDKLAASAKFIGAVAAIIGSVLIPYYLHSNAEENRKAQMYAQIMTEREQADTSLRSEMFKTLITNYLGKFTGEKETEEMDSKPPSMSEQETDETKYGNILYNKVMFLSLLTKNFQEYFNVKPLFEQLYRLFQKEEDKILEKLFGELKSEEGKKIRKKLYRKMKNANDEKFEKFYNELKSEEDETISKTKLEETKEDLENKIKAKKVVSSKAKKNLNEMLKLIREDSPKQSNQNSKKSENNRTTTQELKNLEQELEKIEDLIAIKELKECFLSLAHKNGLKTFDELQEKTKKLIEKLKKIKELKGRLLRLARSIASKQATMLSRLGRVQSGELRFYNGSVFKNKSKQESENNALKYEKLGEKILIKLYDIDRGRSDNNSISKKSSYHSIELKVVGIKEGADEVEFEARLYKDYFRRKFKGIRLRKSFDHREPVGTDFRFSVSYFDMPYMDNTRLYNGTRFAVILRDIKRNMGNVKIELEVITFREEFMTLRDRPLFEEMLTKLRQD